MSGQATGSSMGGGGGGPGGGGGGEDEAMQLVRAKKIEAMEANRAYQATRLYSTPPVYAEHDDRRETGNYGLTHMVMTITVLRCFEGIIRYLKPSEAARVTQARKIFGSAVEAAEEQIVRHLHALHFSRVPLPLPVTSGGAGGGGEGGASFSWTRYLHERPINKSHKILLMGHCDVLLRQDSSYITTNEHAATNRVDMMVIDEKGTKISWQTCAPMVEIRWGHTAYYCQGEVFSVSSCDVYVGADGTGTSERYDVLSQTAVELEHKLPIPNLCGVAMAELNGRAFAIGGFIHDAATGEIVTSDRVFCLDNKRHRGQAGTWIEQEVRLITDRSGAAAATYQGKVWLAGGGLSSIEVFDPLVGSWQASGDLTKARYGIALFVIKDDLFAAGGEDHTDGVLVAGDVIWVEKRDKQTGAWKLVSELRDGEMRRSCALAACGPTIYFFGGGFYPCSWNSFDTRTNTWASQQGQYQDVATRQLPRSFHAGQAVCITPSEQLGTWTSYPDFVHRDEEEEEEKEEKA